jgi:hypothetical protein
MPYISGVILSVHLYFTHDKRVRLFWFPQEESVACISSLIHKGDVTCAHMRNTHINTGILLLQRKGHMWWSMFSTAEDQSLCITVEVVRDNSSAFQLFF